MQAAAEELMRAAVGGGERNGEAEVWDDHQGKDDAGGGGGGDGDGGGDAGGRTGFSHPNNSHI